MGIMKLTKRHLHFYWEKKGLPAWAERAELGALPVSVHELIPDPESRRDPSYAAHNLMSLIKSYMRQGKDIVQEFLRIADNPGTLINPNRRAALARKWAKRIQLERFSKMVKENHGTS